MVTKSLLPDDEKDYVDLVTHAMFSLGFLHDISNLIPTEQAKHTSVAQFYAEWLQRSGRKEDFVPFSMGAIFGYMCAGIMLVKENWLPLIPTVDLMEAGDEWGLNEATLSLGPKTRPEIRDVVRRLRNGLGHGNVRFLVPEQVNRENIMTVVEVEFWDVGLRDPKDTFSLRMPLAKLAVLVRKLHKTVHDHVASKFGRTSDA